MSAHSGTALVPSVRTAQAINGRSGQVRRNRRSGRAPLRRTLTSQPGRRRDLRLTVLGHRCRLGPALIAAAVVQADGNRPVHAGRPAEALEDANDNGGDIDLPRIGAMPGTGRIGMVHVVPAFAEGEQREGPEVGGTVVAPGSEGTGTDHVAQRVDTPGDVLQ